MLACVCSTCNLTHKRRYTLMCLSMLQQQAQASSIDDAADVPATPASQAGSTTPASTCSLQEDTPCSSSGLSTGRSTAPFALGSCRSSALLHRGRRSSMLHAAALPGHQLCREAPASRSLLLHRMSKARQRAFLAYTEQMAKYYAEVRVASWAKQLVVACS
jgi:hypothetical protein